MIGINIIFSTELSEEWKKKENNIFTSTLADYHLFSGLSDDLSCSNTKSPAWDKREKANTALPPYVSSDPGTRGGAINAGDKYIAATDGGRYCLGWQGSRQSGSDKSAPSNSEAQTSDARHQANVGSKVGLNFTHNRNSIIRGVAFPYTLKIHCGHSNTNTEREYKPVLPELPCSHSSVEGEENIQTVGEISGCCQKDVKWLFFPAPRHL